jgi:hypothetical protein
VELGGMEEGRKGERERMKIEEKYILFYFYLLFENKVEH